MEDSIRRNDGDMINCTDCIKHGGDWECDRTHCRKGTKHQATKASDCISRQATIDVLHEYFDGMLETDTWSPCEVYGLIEILPSVHPEPCEDAVSRKAVEEMLKNGFPARGMWEIEGDVVKQTVCETLADALMDLEKLPSTELERKKGKWTATYSDCDGDVWVSWKCSNCGYVRKKGWEHTDNGRKPDALFCEMCNADMRGEQDEID